MSAEIALPSGHADALDALCRQKEKRALGGAKEATADGDAKAARHWPGTTVGNVDR